MSSGVYGGDEVGAIVLDIGSHTVRGGFAGEDMPKADFPTTVGILEQGENSVDSMRDKKYYIDTVNVKVPRASMELVNFLQDGSIDDWDIFEKLFDYFYAQHVMSTPDSHPLLMSEPAWNPRGKREKLTEILFEKYNVPAFFLCKNAVLSAFSHGRSTGLVLDSGATHTSAVPVYDGYVVQQAVVRSPLAGDFILNECQKLLDELKIGITPQYLIAEKEAVSEGQPARWKPKENLQVTSSFHDSAVRDVLRDFAATVLQVSDNTFEEEEESLESMSPVKYEFPNGYSRHFGIERFRLTESLFNPSFIKDNLASNTSLSTGHVVSSSVGMCDIDIRPSLYNSVMIVGGNSLLNGFCDRVQIELGAKLPPSMKLKMTSAPVNAERRFSSWIGGSILASLGSFQQLWISKQEYEECGKGCVDRKCP